MIRTVYKIPKAGNLAKLKMEQEELAAPEPHEVQVEVHAIGLNFADIFAIQGLYSATPKGAFIPGLEFSGNIIAMGENVNSFVIGQRVMGVMRFGAYASHINLENSYLMPIPEEWSLEEAAAFPVQALTAYYGLFYLGRLQKNETVLIHSAAGGVGLLANRMAKKAGARTIGTVGNSDKVSLLQAEGYDDWIVRSADFKDQLKVKIAPAGLDLVMECIGGSVFKDGYNLLNPQGRMIVYGSARYTSTGKRPNWLKIIPMYLSRPRIDPQKMIESNKAVMGFNLIWLYHQVDLMHQLLHEIKALKLDAPFIGHLFEFEQIPEALSFFQSGKSMGKVVIQLK